MGIHSESLLDRRYVELLRLLNTYLNHFPRHEKYGLSQQIRQCAYSLYGFIVESQKRYQKKTSLTNADICHEQLRMFVRLANELGYFGFTAGERDEGPAVQGERRYLAISKLIDEIGRMLGGWVSAERDKAQQATATRDAS